MLSDFSIARNALRKRGVECYLVDGTKPPVYDVVYNGEFVLRATKDYIVDTDSLMRALNSMNGDSDSLGLLHDSVHYDLGNARPAKAVRVQKDIT